MPREVAMLPYIPTGEAHLGVGDQEILADKAGMPNTLWKLPLGQPVVSITIAESEKPKRCEEIKGLLEPYLRMDQENAVCFRSGLGYFDWPLIIRPGQQLQDFAAGMSSPAADAPAVQKQKLTLSRILASLLASYRLSGERQDNAAARLPYKQAIQAWLPVLPQLPIAQSPEFVRNSIQQAFAFAQAA